MTEDEAKTKMCVGPQVIGTVIALASTTPIEVVENAGRCIASDCMAWRATDNESGPAAPGEPDPPSKPAGYCGLAGKP